MPDTLNDPYSFRALVARHERAAALFDELIEELQHHLDRAAELRTLAIETATLLADLEAQLEAAERWHNFGQHFRGN